MSAKDDKRLKTELRHLELALAAHREGYASLLVAQSHVNALGEGRNVPETPEYWYTLRGYLDNLVTQASVLDLMLKGALMTLRGGS